MPVGQRYFGPGRPVPSGLRFLELIRMSNPFNRRTRTAGYWGGSPRARTSRPCTRTLSLRLQEVIKHVRKEERQGPEPIVANRGPGPWNSSADRRAASVKTLYGRLRRPVMFISDIARHVYEGGDCGPPVHRQVRKSFPGAAPGWRPHPRHWGKKNPAVMPR